MEPLRASRRYLHSHLVERVGAFLVRQQNGTLFCPVISSVVEKSRGSEHERSGTVLLFPSVTERYAAVRGRTALPSASPTNTVEISRKQYRYRVTSVGDFSTPLTAHAVRFGRNDIYKETQITIDRTNRGVSHPPANQTDTVSFRAQA